MIFDNDGFEHDPCWDSPFWAFGCYAEGDCPEEV